MCQNVRHYGCGHLQKRRTVCYKTGNRRGAAAHPNGLVQAILDFLFPATDAACDDMTGEVRPVGGPCPACALSRKHGLVPGGGKPLPHLPGPARLYREASQAKATVGDQRSALPRIDRERKGKTAKELDVASPAAGKPMLVTRRPWHHRAQSPLSRRAPFRPGVRDGLAKQRPADPSSGPSTRSDCSPVTSRPKPYTTPTKRDSVVGGPKSALNRWRFDYLLKSRYRGSVDSDRSFVSPAARRIENGEIDVWTRPRKDKEETTSWI